MITVTLVSLAGINLDAIKVYASDRLGITQDIMQLETDKENTTVISRAKNVLSDLDIQSIVEKHEVQQLAIHPVKPMKSVLKQKINNYSMPFNTLPPVNKVLIPGINVDAPIVANFSKTPEQVETGDFDDQLKNGVALYPTTPNPWQKGHTLLFWHSSSEAWNPSKYNAVFAQLPNLEAGNEFSIVWNGQLYEYRIVEKDIIVPKDMQKTFSKWDTNQKNYLTLITCRPIGTTQKRMTVTAELIEKKTDNSLALND